MWPRTIIATEKKPQSPKTPDYSYILTEGDPKHDTELTLLPAQHTHHCGLLGAAQALPTCPNVPWQRFCLPGSALKAQPSLFLPSTLHISDDLEQRVRAVMMTKLPNREDEQEGTEASEQSRAALAPVPSTGNALRDTMTAAPPSPGDRAPAARQEVPRLSQAVRSLCVPLVTSDRSTHAGNHRGSTRPPAATGATGGKCHPVMGQLPPQDTFLPQLFIHKAPKKQTPWFVQTEMWHLLTKNWVVTVQKHLHIPASQKTILEIQANIPHFTGFYRGLSSPGHSNWQEC